MILRVVKRLTLIQTQMMTIHDVIPYIHKRGLQMIGALKMKITYIANIV